MSFAIFFLVCSLSFHFLDNIFHRADFFFLWTLMKSSLSKMSFIEFPFSIVSKKSWTGSSSMCVCVKVNIIYPFIYQWTLKLFPFMILTIINNVTMNIECRYHFELVFSLSSDKYLEMELLDHILVVFLIFWRSFILFSPPIEHKCSLFPTSSTLVISFW